MGSGSPRARSAPTRALSRLSAPLAHCDGCRLLGWGTFNAFGCGEWGEDELKEIVGVMVDSGLREAGYEYLNLECAPPAAGACLAPSPRPAFTAQPPQGVLARDRAPRRRGASSRAARHRLWFGHVCLSA